MNITQIGEFLLNILDRFGILGAVVIALSILVFKFGDKLMENLANKITSGKFSFPSTARKARKDAGFKLTRLLNEVMHKLEADRAVIFEYHNGGYNLTGLPFLHYTLTHQRYSLGLDEINPKEFDNMLVSLIPEFITEVDKNVIHYVNDIDEIKDTFPKLYKDLKDDGIVSAIFCSLEGVNDQIGFLMLAFKQSPEVSRQKITRELTKKLLKISTLLDYKNLK